MSACPLCQAPWPEPAAGAVCMVCPMCYSVFDHDTARVWQLVPPSPSAARPLPAALGSLLDITGQRYRVAGFAEWSYDIEHYRDMVDTYYRREFTLVSERDRSLAILGDEAGAWWLAREVPASTIDRGKYKPRFGQYYSVQQAAGLLPHRFRWNAHYLPPDHVAEPFGAGSSILLREGAPDAPTVWAGEFLPVSSLPEWLRPAVAAPVPPVLIVPASGRASAPADLSPVRSSWARRLAVAAITIGIFAGIAAFAYYRERRTTSLVKRWVDCPTLDAKARLPIPADAGRVQLDAHLTTGVIQYQFRFLNPSGTVGGASVAALLDMAPAHREPIHAVHSGASELEMTCSLPIPVEGRLHWLVEVRFLR